MLGLEAQSSARAAGTLNYKAIYPVTSAEFYRSGKESIFSTFYLNCEHMKHGSQKNSVMIDKVISLDVILNVFCTHKYLLH